MKSMLKLIGIIVFLFLAVFALPAGVTLGVIMIWVARQMILQQENADEWASRLEKDVESQQATIASRKSDVTP